MNASALIFARLAEYSTTLGEEPAVIGDDDCLSFRRLNFLVEQLAVDFRLTGVAAGLVVGLRFRDPLRHLVASLALLKEGVTQVAIPPRESASAQKKMADTMAVEMIVGDELEPSFEGLPLALIDADWRLRWEAAALGQIASDVRASGPALIFLGSGTTGHPKVMAVGFPLLAQLIERDLAVRDLRQGERHYCESSFDYYTAKRRTFGCLAAGVTVMLPRGPAHRLVAYCQEHSVHHVSLTTSQATTMLAREQEFSTSDFPRLPALRSIFVGSSPVSESTRQRIRREISGQLFVVYGSNEFGEATVASPDDQDRHPDTVGRACPGVLLEVVDDSGKPCQAGENGHVRLQSSPMMHGYEGDSSASNKNFRDGWYYPGDLGSLSDDGNLIFRGRLDDMMICRGVNIYPREIEVVLESHPAISEAAAFPMRTETLDNLPFAVVVCAENVSEVELMKYCQAHLGWRRPLRIFFTAAFPRNQAGKVLKRVLAQTVAERINARKV